MSNRLDDDSDDPKEEEAKAEAEAVEELLEVLRDDDELDNFLINTFNLKTF